MSLQEQFWHLDVHCNIINLHASFIYVFSLKNVNLFQIYGTTQSNLIASELSESERMRSVYTQGPLSLKNLWKIIPIGQIQKNVHIHIQCNVFNERPPQLRNKTVVSP